MRGNPRRSPRVDRQAWKRDSTFDAERQNKSRTQPGEGSARSRRSPEQQPLAARPSTAKRQTGRTAGLTQEFIQKLGFQPDLREEVLEHVAQSGFLESKKAQELVLRSIA